jgi:alginate O-acetyltransferase complex protein AlgI
VNDRGRVMPAPLAWFITFHFICLTWDFFRAPSFENATDYLRALLSNHSISTTISPLVACALAFGALTQLFPGFWHSCKSSFERAPLVLKVAVSSAALFLISVAAPVGVPPFIYYQF